MHKMKNIPAALDHALYEIEMLTYALLKLCDSNLSPDDHRGWMEVFAIHARNLNEFFAKKNFKGAYMKPDHFVPWTYSYQINAKLERRASSQVAHLTYDREKPEEKTQWQFELIFKTLREPSLTFLRAVVIVESLMAYRANKTRTEKLLDLLPQIRFPSDADKKESS
jgi:hypothetical protein